MNDKQMIYVGRRVNYENRGRHKKEKMIEDPDGALRAPSIFRAIRVFRSDSFSEKTNPNHSLRLSPEAGSA